LKRELAAEARTWVREGLLSEAQAEQILARYGTRLPGATERSAGYYVLVSLAALFAGLALLVLVSANWDQIPRGARMGGLLAVTLAFHTLGVRSWHRGAEAVASTWFFLGCLAYGTAIFLIAQIYHLGEHYPDGIFWWALGSLPFALLARSLPVALLTVVLTGAWLVAETSESFVPVAWPLLGAGLGAFCLWVRSSKLVFLGWIATGTFWLEVLVSRWLSETRNFSPPAELLPMSLALFVLYQAWGRAWEDRQEPEAWSDYGLVLRLWSVRLALVLLLVFSFEDPWRGVLETRYDAPAFVGLCVVAVLGGVAALSWRALRAGSPRAGWWSVWAHAGAVTFLVAVAAFTNSAQVGWAVPLQVLTNLACVGTGVWLIVAAIEEGLTHYFYAGVGLLLLTALLRYVDLVGDYVGASVLFFVFALILLGAARFWRHRLEGVAS
jgi:uncharacterized membrane protein